MINVGGDNLTRSRSWFMIFFLSILPGFIFLWDWNPDGEEKYRRDFAMHQWYQQVEKVADTFRKSSDSNFWQGLSAKRFKNLYLANVRAGHGTLKALEIAHKVFRPAGFPAPGVKLFFKKAGEWNSESIGKGSKGADYLLKKLFSQMVDKACGRPAQLEESVWEQRIKMLFGHMNFPDLFFPQSRMVPFSAIIRGRPFTLMWDFFEDQTGNMVEGGFFFYFPESYDKTVLPSELITRYWGQICDKKETVPVLIPINSNDEKVIVHPLVDGPEIRKNIREFRKKYIKRVKSSVPELADKARLPGELFGRPFMLGKYAARLCNLNPVCGHIGLLVSEPSTPEKAFRQTISTVYFLIAGVLWGMFLIHSLIFWLIPPVNLRFRVMAWFLAFAAFPAGLTISAWSSLIQDFEVYRVDQIQKGLHSSILNLQAGVSQIDAEYLEASMEVIHKKNFVPSVVNLPQAPSLDKSFFDKIFADYESRKINLQGALLVTQGGWCFSRLSDGLSSRSKASIKNGLSVLLNQYFYAADRKLYERFEAPKDGMFTDKKVPSILQVKKLDVYSNIYAIRECFGRVTDINVVGKSFLQFMYQINLDGKPFAVFIAFWDWTSEFNERVRLLMSSESLRFRKNQGLAPDIAAYQATSTGQKLIAKTGNVSGLMKIADFPVEKNSKFSDLYSATVMIPFSRIPGIRFVARVATSNIKMQVMKEKGLIIFSVTTLLLIVLLGSSGASLWVTEPINRFNEFLRQLNAGLEPQLSDVDRDDELGIAAKSLGRMAGWIMERERLLKFVSPKALETVSDGNPFKAGAGSIQEVTILVSDIRSFTTLSEEYSPESVFKMVNNHLQEMAEKIESNFGIIDRYVGDAVWAVFYDKHPQGGENALRAALKMMKAHRRIQQQRIIDGEFAYDIGIGVVKGEVLVGVMGDSSVRLDFTVVGDALNKAEEMEGLSKFATKTGIVFSEDLGYCAAKSGISFEPMSEIPGVCEVCHLE